MAAGDVSVLTEVAQEVLDFAKDVAQDIAAEYPQGFGLVEVSTKEIRSLIRQAMSGDNEPMEKYQGRNAMQELQALEQRNGPPVWAEIDIILREYGLDVEQIRTMMMASPLPVEGQPPATAAQPEAAPPGQGQPIPY